MTTLFKSVPARFPARMTWPKEFKEPSAVQDFVFVLFTHLQEKFSYHQVELEGDGEDSIYEAVKIHWEEKYESLNYDWDLYDHDFHERCVGLSILCIPPKFPKYWTYRFQLNRDVIVDPADFSSEKELFWYMVETCMHILLDKAEKKFPPVRPRPLRGDNLEVAVEALLELEKLKTLPGDHSRAKQSLTDELNMIFLDEHGLRYVPDSSAPYIVKKYVENLKKHRHFPAPAEDDPSIPVRRHEHPRNAKDLPVMRSKMLGILGRLSSRLKCMEVILSQ